MKLSPLQSYNAHYNNSCSGLTHGGPVAMEHLQALAIESAVKALSGGSGTVPVSDLLELSDKLWGQGSASIQTEPPHDTSLDGL